MTWAAFGLGMLAGAAVAYVVERVIEYRLWYGP